MARDTHSVGFRGVVVSYERRADRYLGYPRSRPHYKRVETWFSPDTDTFVSRRETR